MIITKTPFRVSFFGGGTDYLPWHRERGGLIIATAITHSCYLSVRRLTPFFGYRSRAVYSKMETVQSNSDFEHPSIRNCLNYLDLTEGYEIHHNGDLPARSGIGSSSTFTVGFLNALHAINYRMKNAAELADQAIEVEHEWIKEHVGIQDQIMAAYGGFRMIELNKDGSYHVHTMILPPDYQKSFEKHCLLAFTGVSRTASPFAKEQINLIREGKNVDALSEIHHIAKEAYSLFKEAADFQKIGDLLDKSWQIKKTLTDNISNESINDLYAKAKKAGAFGGKLLGAGGGGFILLFAPPETHQQIKDSLPEIKIWVPLSFEKCGSRVIFHGDLENAPASINH